MDQLENVSQIFARVSDFGQIFFQNSFDVVPSVV